VPVKPALFELSQWWNKTSTGGIELHSKALALSVALPLGCRGAAAAFPSSLSSYHLRSPTRHAILRSRLALLSGLGPQTTKLSDVVVLPRGVHFIFPFLLSLSLLLS